MQRSSIIATVVAAGGILIAGSVASVAVINAASSSQPQATTQALVSTETTESSAAAEPTAAPTVELPSLDPAALPEIPVVDDSTPPAAAPAVQAAPAPKAAKKHSSDTKNSDTQQQADTQSQAPGISANEAASIVLKQGGGTKVLAVSKSSHGGYSTYAVRIERPTGEIITGYVDRESGVVVDWTVNQKPAAQPTPSKSHGGDDSEEGDDHGGDHSHGGDSGEFEGQDD